MLVISGDITEIKNTLKGAFYNYMFIPNLFNTLATPIEETITYTTPTTLHNQKVVLDIPGRS